jgi:hypothetical protein
MALPRGLRCSPEKPAVAEDIEPQFDALTQVGPRGNSALDVAA